MYWPAPIQSPAPGLLSPTAPTPPRPKSPIAELLSPVHRHASKIFQHLRAKFGEGTNSETHVVAEKHAAPHTLVRNPDRPLPVHQPLSPILAHALTHTLHLQVVNFVASQQALASAEPGPQPMCLGYEVSPDPRCVGEDGKARAAVVEVHIRVGGAVRVMRTMAYACEGNEVQIAIGGYENTFPGVVGGDHIRKGRRKGV